MTNDMTNDMTNEQAILVLTQIKQKVTADTKSYSPMIRQAAVGAVDIGVDAINKQIPKKPEQAKKARFGMGYEYYDWFCPTCGRFLAFETSKGDHHCTCGQAIDWD